MYQSRRSKQSDWRYKQSLESLESLEHVWRCKFESNFTCKINSEQNATDAVMDAKGVVTESLGRDSDGSKGCSDIV